MEKEKPEPGEHAPWCASKRCSECSCDCHSVKCCFAVADMPTWAKDCRQHPESPR